MNSITFKIRQAKKAILLKKAASTNFVLIEWGSGLICFRFARISGAIKAISIVCPAPKKNESANVIPQTKFTNFFAPI